MNLSKDEKRHLDAAMESLGKTRVFLEPLNSKSLCRNASRHIEHALVSLALLTYSPERQVEPKHIRLFRWEDNQD